MNEVQKEWLGRQTKQLTDYYNKRTVSMTEEDFDWLVDMAEAIIDKVLEKSTSMVINAEVRTTVLDALEKIEIHWRSANDRTNNPI